MFEMPFIIAERCDGCGACIEVCRCNGLLIVNNVVTIIENVECDWCTECEAVCPTGAIVCAFEIVLEKPQD